MHALRRGAEMTVKLTNYKRSGETFASLLSIRPVHDSHGVYRFCVAVQGEASHSHAHKELQKAFVSLLPTQVPSPWPYLPIPDLL